MADDVPAGLETARLVIAAKGEEEMRTERIVKLFSTTAFCTAALAIAAPASAQDTAPVNTQGGTQAAEAGEAEQTLIVTGSRIVRDGYTAPTPVTVASSEDLLNATPSSLPDGLNKLPQFSNSLGASRAASNFSNLPIHGNVLNLRGLGTTGANPKGPLRTLILFDGIRMPPTEYVGTVDTNVIPQLLIERVDIVTGGASAAWGSDAVAGVVNFILDRDFEGINGVAQAGVDQRGDNENYRLGVAAGLSFAEGRGHVLLSGEVYDNQGMLRADRNVALQGYNFVGANPGTGPGGGNLQPGSQGNPFTIRPDVRISALAPNGRIVGSSVAGNPFVGRVINNDGTTRPFNTGVRVGTTGFQEGGDGYKITPFNTAVLPVTNYQAFGRLSYDITPDINVYAQGIWARSDFSFPTQTNALVPPTQAVTIFSGNPFLPADIQASLGPTGSITIGQYDAGQPQPVSEERTEFWMVTAGIEGRFGNGWRWDISYSHGSSEHSMETSGLYENQFLYAAADAVINPANGQITCRVLLDPVNAARFAGCTPINFLRGDPARTSPAGYDYVTGTSSYDASIDQDFVAASLRGSLFELPAGPVDFAIGVEYRDQSLRLISNADPARLDTDAEREAFFAGLRGVPRGAPSATNPLGSTLPLFYWLTNVGSASGSEGVTEGFAELAVPLLRDRAGFDELSLNGAIRYTDYEVSGGVTTWKVGAVWSPVEDVLIRSTYSRDIRAPNLFELFSGAQSAIGIVNDTVSGLNRNVSSVISGNPNLEPEKADTLTVGLVLRPRFFPGFSASIDFYSIEIAGLIDQLSAQQILTNCNNSSGSAPECALIDRPSATEFPTLIRVQPANIASLETRGIDFDASYNTRLAGGQLSVRLYANYLARFNTQQFTGAPTLRFAGINVVGSNPAAYPRWRGNLSLTYTNGPFGITISEQYVGPMTLDIPGNLANGARSFFVDPKVSAEFYTDLTLRATIPAFGGEIEPFMTVNNLFDNDPPLIPGTVPGVNFPTNIAVFDVIGRSFTFGARFRF